MKTNAILSILAAAAMTAAAMPAFAATQEALLKVSDIKVARHGDELTIALDIDPRAVNPGRDKEVTFTPVVRAKSGADSLELPAVKIAGRNRYYSHIRNNNLPLGTKVYNAGSGEIINYRAEVPFEAWMERCQIDMRQDLANCCEKAQLGPDTPLARLDLVRPEFEPKFNFVELTGDSAIELTAEGRAYVDFIVNRTEIRPTYRKNTVEIAKIIASIDKVKNDPDATITRITIKGYASPEGPYDNNIRLAMGRTASLKEYVREHYNFDPEIMSTDYEPEDWEGPREWVLKCDLPHRDEILQIIDSPLAPDPKNSAIQQTYPKEYKLILDSVYPGLRHSDYTVKYRIKAYATVEELLEVYKVTPERMRPVDFQRIAAVYPTGSDKYKEIMLKAVEIHPYDPKSNLNAATIAMQAGDLAKAAEYLDRAGDTPEAVYSRGVLAGLQGDLARAEQVFETAAQLGLEQAAEAKGDVHELINRPTVEYLIEPSEK